MLFQLVINNPTNTVTPTIEASSPAPQSTIVTSNSTISMTSVRFVGSPSKIVMSLDDQSLFFFERKPCHPDCATCNGVDSNQCLSCLPGMLFDSQRCYTCHSSCLTCTPTSAPFCATCAVSDFLTPWIWNSSSIVTCKSKLSDTFIDGSSFQRFCHQNCSTCIAASTCVICKPGYYKIDGTDTCIKCSLDTKSAGYYYDSVTQTCKTCDINCSTCTSSSVLCTACPSLFEVSRLNRTCVSTTPTVGSFFDATYTTSLLACDLNCLTCSV